MGERVMSAQSLTEQHGIIVETIQELLQCQAALWLNQKVLSTRQNGGDETGSLTETMEQACQESRLVRRTQPAEAEYRSRKSRDSKKQPAYNLAVPITFAGELLGALSISRYSGPDFTSQEIDFFIGCALQCGLNLHAAHQISIDQKKFEMLALVRTVSSQIADIMDLDDLARQITGLILVTFDYYFAAIFTIEPGNEALNFRGSAGPLHPTTPSIEPTNTSQGSLNSTPFLSVQLGQGIIGSVALTGVEVVANDASEDPHFRAMDVLPETKSEAAFPLKIENRILGVLDVQSDQSNAFDETDTLVLGALADNIATAVENARLYCDVRTRAEQLSSLAQVSNAITSILNLDDLLIKVVDLLHERFENQQVHIFIIHSVPMIIEYIAGDEINHQSLAGRLPLEIDWETPDQIIAWVATKRETALISDSMKEAAFRPWNIFNSEMRSEIAVPLLFGNDALGVLDLQSREPGTFRGEDQFLLEALADNLAIAMRNARLYSTEQWRRQVADSMREVAVLLTAEADLEQVLDTILTELHRTLPCDIVAIWLKSGDIEPEEGTPSLYLAAVRTSDSLREEYSIEGMDINAELFQSCASRTTENTLLSMAMQSENPLIRAPEMPLDPLSEFLNFPENSSSIAAALRVSDRPLGVLTLSHHTSGRYGRESQLMTATFASYAAVSIENTRLYEASHDQAWVSTVLLEITEAIQSLASLDELLATIVRITPMLIGLDSCAIFLWDNSEEVFIPVAAHGLSEDQLQLFQLWHTSLGDDPAFDQLYFGKEPVFFSYDDQNVGSMHSLIFKPSESPGGQSLVLFPMVAHGDMKGALLIAHHIHQSTAPNGHSPDSIDLDDKFAIIQGIAQQTAVAIENILLLKSQKEEAYVSVALLQVAQAIVSLNALDEILEAIVRITPILIGVKRSLIFLWNAADNTYILSQAYGITRAELNELQSFYRPDEFPLLEAVRRTNNLAYHVYDESTDLPVSWSSLSEEMFLVLGFEQPDVTGEQADQKPVNNREYMKTNGSLLYAYPLSVKGSVLGVMLTQEMNGNVVPSMHIREKRQEISIGITQQAAMAIQNDLLQSEVVERERLEKEMQLARGIQQSFLPDSLPENQGWDLDARWQPAREVGGDFYDVFELPGNKLGIVIADVADKGMPAALYMTLIRTLIRANAREDPSPASVLKRVNDLLVNDSKNGMFVTVAYAVVSLDSGKVAYANAGHNYPFILSGAWKLKRLPTTAMALGIMSEMTVGQKDFQLKPEDSLVFYTDGVTEAFSSSDEMFGEKRLRSTISRFGRSTMSNLLQAIESAVRDFTAGAPPSDDITLLALKYKPVTATVPFSN